jgi:hypothetical protein
MRGRKFWHGGDRWLLRAIAAEWSGGGDPTRCGATQRRSRGFSPTSGRRLAGSGPEPAAWAALGWWRSRGGEVGANGVPPLLLCRVAWIKRIELIQNLNGIKQFQIFPNFHRSKKYFPELKKLKENMVLKGLNRGTIFYIESSPDSKWALNENSEKLLGLKFNRIDIISSWNLPIGIKLGQETCICT